MKYTHDLLCDAPFWSVPPRCHFRRSLVAWQSRTRTPARPSRTRAHTPGRSIAWLRSPQSPAVCWQLLRDYFDFENRYCPIRRHFRCSHADHQRPTVHGFRLRESPGLNCVTPRVRRNPYRSGENRSGSRQWCCSAGHRGTAHRGKPITHPRSTNAVPGRLAVDAAREVAARSMYHSDRVVELDLAQQCRRHGDHHLGPAARVVDPKSALAVGDLVVGVHRVDQ